MTTLYRSILEAASDTVRDVVRDNPNLTYPLAVVASLASKIAQDVDCFVPVRLEEIGRLKELLAQGREFAPAALASAIEGGLKLAPVSPQDYRISSLDAICSHLRGLLIDLHTCLETMPEAAVQDILEAIFAFLETDAQMKARSASMLW